MWNKDKTSLVDFCELFYKYSKHEPAVQACGEALILNRTNTSLLEHIGTSSFFLKDLDTSYNALKEAYELKP